MEVLSWAFGLTVGYVLLQQGDKVGVLGDLANGAITRAMSPSVAGVPNKAAKTTQKAPAAASGTVAPIVPTPFNGNGLGRGPTLSA